MQSIKTIFSLAAGDTVTVNGWVKTRRDTKAGLSFVSVSDGSCPQPLQLIVPNSLANYTDQVLHLTAGCAVEAVGTVAESPGQGQSIEVQVTALRVLGWVENPDTYPISPKRHTLEYLREYAHLRVRTNIISAITRIRHQAAYCIHQFFHERGFVWVNTPIITANDCEGAGELFRVSTLDLMNLPRDSQHKIDFGEDFFAEEAFLTVSGQLNVETYCMAMSKVYTFGPTFRAENSNTSRHLAEFWMIEPEIAFANLTDCIELATAMLKHVATTMLTVAEADMAFFTKRVDQDCVQRLSDLIAKPFQTIDYSEAISILQQSKQSFEYSVSWGDDLQTEHERFLAETYVQGPVVITNYPKDIKGFYMRVNDDDKTVSAMDVLVPGIGEIIGGSAREERLAVLDQRLQDCSLDAANYYWYRDLRRYGTVPHAGFGLGFERLLGYITGVSNVRDLIPFPRTPKHIGF